MTEASLLTFDQVGKRLGCKRSKVYGLIARGELDSVKCGRHRRVPQEWLEDYIERLKLAARREAGRSVVEAIKEAGKQARRRD